MECDYKVVTKEKSWKLSTKYIEDVRISENEDTISQSLWGMLLKAVFSF